MNLDSEQYTDNGQTLHIAAAWLLLFTPGMQENPRNRKNAGNKLPVFTKTHRVAKTSGEGG